jgi:hypothetical protein
MRVVASFALSAWHALLPVRTLCLDAHAGARRRLRAPSVASRTCACASTGRGNSLSSGGSDRNVHGEEYFEYGQPEYSSDILRWTDRVALQAQVGSAVDTLEVILAALRNNKAWADVGLPGDKRRKDEGLEALYTFANFDVWSLRTDFFGRSLDLGQFERFKRIMVCIPYDILLVGDYEILSNFRTNPNTFCCRVLFRAPRRDETVFIISMSRVRTGTVSSWMIDSLIHDPTQGDGTQDTAGT